MYGPDPKGTTRYVHAITLGLRPLLRQDEVGCSARSCWYEAPLPRSRRSVHLVYYSHSNPGAHPWRRPLGVIPLGVLGSRRIAGRMPGRYRTTPWTPNKKYPTCHTRLTKFGESFSFGFFVRLHLPNPHHPISLLRIKSIFRSWYSAERPHKGDRPSGGPRISRIKRQILSGHSMG